MIALLAAASATDTSQYMVLGYLVLWGAIFAYAFVLHRKTGAIQRKIESLSETISHLEQTGS